MKKKLLFICLLISAATFSYSQSTDKYPVFILNDSFLHAQPKESKIEPRNYQLNNLQGFKLDCSKYDFTAIRNMNDGKNPDAVFIICKAGNFIVEFNPSEQIIIDASTMNPLDDAKIKFTEFQKGDTPILGIGTLELKDDKVSMKTYWVSMIDVK